MDIMLYNLFVGVQQVYLVYCGVCNLRPVEQASYPLYIIQFRLWKPEIAEVSNF